MEEVQREGPAEVFGNSGKQLFFLQTTTIYSHFGQFFAIYFV